MKFMKFSSLENTFRQNILSKIEMHGLTLPSEQWMATEKLHGANLGVYCDGEKIQVACRTKMLEEGESFFNVWSVLEKYQENILSYASHMFEDLNKYLNESSGTFLKVKPYMILTGELFGGSIQKNMPYGEEQDLHFFDQNFIFGVEDLDTIKKVFGSDCVGKVYNYCVVEDKVIVVPKNKLGVRSSLINYGLKYVPLIAVGTFEQMMDVSNDFHSVMYNEAYVKSFKLAEEHEDLRKKSEGLVLEPVRSAFIVQDRVYLKNRSSKFEEKKREPKKNLVQRQLEDFTPKAVFVLEHIEDRLNMDRFESVISKIGEVSIRDINQIVGLMLQDAIEDFQKDELYDMDTDSVGSMENYLENKAEVKAIKKMCTFTALNLIRPTLLTM